MEELKAYAQEINATRYVYTYFRNKIYKHLHELPESLQKHTIFNEVKLEEALPEIDKFLTEI